MSLQTKCIKDNSDARDNKEIHANPSLQSKNQFQRQKSQGRKDQDIPNVECPLDNQGHQSERIPTNIIIIIPHLKKVKVMTLIHKRSMIRTTSRGDG